MRGLSLLLMSVGLLVPWSTIAADSWSGLWRIPGQKPYSELRTIDHGGGDVGLQLDLWGGPPAYNSGGMEGHLSVKDGRGAFETTEYAGDLPNGIRLCSEAGDRSPGGPIWAECGFGHSVVADGKFVRISRKLPTFIHR